MLDQGWGLGYCGETSYHHIDERVFKYHDNNNYFLGGVLERDFPQTDGPMASGSFASCRRYHIEMKQPLHCSI